MAILPLNNHYFSHLEGFYVPWQGAAFPQPKSLWVNAPLAEELGIDPAFLSSLEGASILTGATKQLGTTPLAQVYAGHQFGHFSPQLGDGRALLLGELTDAQGNMRDLHLKGSGRTPFSRNGDGKAAIGPVLRECLISEAMHALHIPTTRALAAMTTGETIIREGYEQGAVLARIASSHIRVGTFQFFAARGDMARVKQLADYAIARHDPDLVEAQDIEAHNVAGAPSYYYAFFNRVIARQVSLIAKWNAVGFVHGVMNTDNVTISGETIDYGPCAFIDAYDPASVFSSIDTGGRYALHNQPKILGWNMARFAEALLPLFHEDEARAIDMANAALEKIAGAYQDAWLSELRRKLGLTTLDAEDGALIHHLHEILGQHRLDYTLFFRKLADAALGAEEALLGLFADVEVGAYASIITFPLGPWYAAWKARVNQQKGGLKAAAMAMNTVNPLYIPRNHKVEFALNAAKQGDLSLFTTLLARLQAPYAEVAGFEDYALPLADKNARYMTFCGT